MQFNRLVVLLPSQSLEDLSLRRTAAEAQQLLAAWTALWHPVLVHAAQTTPSWGRAEAPPEDPTGQLIVVPPCSQRLLPCDWLERMSLAGAAVICEREDREAIIGQALSWIENRPETDVDPELVNDFRALGLCYLYVELLTRQLRYMSNLDEGTLQTRTLAAAKAAVEGDRPTARSQLQSGFDVLSESREYFYPVEATLVDLTLVAPGMAGEALRNELSNSAAPVNLLLGAETLQALAHEEPETVTAIAQALSDGRASLIGGEFHEGPLPLLPPEAIEAEIRHGLKVYEQLVSARPTVFGRRRFGLTPFLPQLLKKSGFQGCLHFTLDDGRFPTGNQSRIRWQGVDGTVLESLARVPVDASSAETFLRFPERLGDALDLDHAATLLFAHWPGQASPWYRDLQRIASFSSVLGAFASLPQQLQQSTGVAQSADYAADQYRSPYLRQAVQAHQRDPLSRWVRYWRRRAVWQSIEAFLTLNSVVTAEPCDRSDAGLREQGAGLREQIELAAENDSDDTQQLDQRLDEAAQAAARVFAASLGTSPEGGPGRLMLNPWPSAYKWIVENPRGDTLPPGAGPGAPPLPLPGRTVDVPGLGFAWERTPQADVRSSVKRGWWPRAAKAPPPLADGNVLRNEFFEITLDPTTGAIRSIVDFAGHGNRLAQQIALRMVENDALPEEWDGPQSARAWYSIMAAEAVEVVTPGPDFGEIRVRGRLCNPYGRRVASFVQTTRLTRGSRILDLHIDLDPETQPDPDPWKSYYCARFAWDDETADLRRGLHGMSRPSGTAYLEAPQFVEIRSGNASTAILTGGLPYHRRQGHRMLDCLLIVEGETARSFRLGVALDVPHLPAAAMEFLAPKYLLNDVPRPSSPTGWLFHFDARNVVATAWEPIVESGRVNGVRVGLLETEGRRAMMSLRCFRPVHTARKLGIGPEAALALPIESDRVRVEIGPYEYAWLECLWQET